MINIAKYIDHTLLKADATAEEVIRLCSEAKEYGFFSVCVNPSFVELCAKELSGSDVKVCTVIGFPLGASTTETKEFETKDAIEKGADEVDMVINISKLKAGDDLEVQRDIEGVVKASGKRALVKVIIETCLLTEEEKKRACQIAKVSGADFVKTSTGFSTGGATKEDIALMRSIVGENMGVKASGGIRSTEDALKMIESGASRIGASASIAILKGLPSESSY